MGDKSGTSSDKSTLETTHEMGDDAPVDKSSASSDKSTLKTTHEMGGDAPIDKSGAPVEAISTHSPISTGISAGVSTPGIPPPQYTDAPAQSSQGQRTAMQSALDRIRGCSSRSKVLVSTVLLHAIIWAAVCTMLFVINLCTTALLPPWFIFPTLGWGLGVFIHTVVIMGIVLCLGGGNDLETMLGAGLWLAGLTLPRPQHLHQA